MLTPVSSRPEGYTPVSETPLNTVSSQQATGRRISHLAGDLSYTTVP